MITTNTEKNETTKLPQVSKKSSDTIGIIFIYKFHQTSYTFFFFFITASATFLTCVAAGAGIFAFASTLASARKTDPTMFSKGQTSPSPTVESGVKLAIRALKWGTFYAFTGCGLFCFGVWKMSGANDASILSA